MSEPADDAAAGRRAAAGSQAPRTVWQRRLQTPLRRFMRTETGGASVLLAAALAALAWANIHPASYGSVWGTRLSLRVGSAGLSATARTFVNSGLMTFFFLVAGLEARREFDMGELRARRRLMLPVLVGLGGMAVPVGIYLAINAGHASARGWGAAMSTDTAFSLGMLALAGTRVPDRARTYLLTFSIVDDVVSLVIIAVAYSRHVSVTALGVGVGIVAVVLVVRLRRVRSGWVYLVLGVAAWVAFFESGVDPLVVGLITGVLALAYPATRSDLEQASETFRLFREQPTAELASQARQSVHAAISPNDRLEQVFQPVTSYLIVPLFALANAGITVSASFLAAALTSPVTIGVFAGYVLGKPAGTVGVAWLLSRASRGRIAPPAGWGAVAGAGTIAGVGFTVSILIATLAFRGNALAQAKAGVLAAALLSSVLTWAVFGVLARLPKRLRLRALLGTSQSLIDLAVPVDPGRDHVRGPAKSPVTLVEYGDFQCPYCGQAEPVVRELLAEVGDVRYVWRHLPLGDVHPQARLAAEAAEAASAQGRFWPMHDLLLRRQDALAARDLVRYARQLGLDVERFRRDLRDGTGAAKVAADTESADLSGVSGTPTIFVNGQRYYGAFDVGALSEAVWLARARAFVGS